MTTTATHERCTKCEEIKRGFTYKHLIDGLCTEHALDHFAGQFVKLTYYVYSPGVDDDRQAYRYGWLAWWPKAREARVAKFCRTINDDGRIYSEAIDKGMVINIEPLTTKEYMDLLCSDRTVVVQHFGWRYSGRIIETARTRVLVRFRARGGKLYERWKPVYAVQPGF